MFIPVTGFQCHSVPVNSGDCSGEITGISKFCGRSEILAGKFHWNGTGIRRNDQNPAGICGASLRPRHLYTHESPFSSFSAHPQDMYYLCICCWRISFWIFNRQFSCANPADAPGIPQFFGISIWFFPRPFIWTPGSPHEA